MQAELLVGTKQIPTTEAEREVVRKKLDRLISEGRMRICRWEAVAERYGRRLLHIPDGDQSPSTRRMVLMLMEDKFPGDSPYQV